jgi:hypothetical protein
VTPEPETLASIRLNGSSTFIAGSTTTYACGCSVRFDHWRLCQYHEGFDEGVEAARRPT